MLPSHQPLATPVRMRGTLLTVALAIALLAAGLAAATGSTAATAAKPVAKRAPRHAPGATAPAPSAAEAGGKALPDSLPRLEAAVRRDSTNAKAHYRLGIAYLDRDRPVDASGQFEQAVRYKPDYVEAWVNRGAAEDANGKGYFARQYYRKALELHPGDQIALCRMASSYYAGAAKDSSMDVIRQILKTDPNASCAYFQLGVSFADASMFREAIRVWQKVVDLAPKSPEAESATESIKLLKDYLGPQEALNAAPVGGPGVALGSGGPDNVIPGGGMNASMGGTAPAGGAKPEKKDDKKAPAKGGDKK